MKQEVYETKSWISTLTVVWAPLHPLAIKKMPKRWAQQPG